MFNQLVGLFCIECFLLFSGCAKTPSPLPLQFDSVQRTASVLRARDRIQVDHLGREQNQLLDESSAELPPYQELSHEESPFDAIHYRVSLEFPASSLLQPAFNGEVQLTFRAKNDPLQILPLDSVGLKVSKILLLNTFENLHFEQRGEKLEIDLGRPYTARESATVVITYRWESRSEGVYFRSRDGVSGIESIYSQSEPELSKFWFPSNAHPNDRATFEAVLRVPSPFVAVSNGALVDSHEENGMRTTHWSMQEPMASYLFVVTAGKWGVHRENWRDIPVEYYGPADDMDRLSYSLRNTPDMLSFFSDRMGFKYPYEKYAQTVVPQYMWGGMEHTTATTLTDRTVHGPNENTQYSSDGLTSHELAHQWFGDLITCKSWDHLWLNEGFATYFASLYTEHSLGRVAYLREMAEASDWYFEEEGHDARPVVFPYYRNGLDDYFDSHAYAKGAWVLHMLRSRLGDASFFAGIRAYLHEYQGQLAVTEDLRRSLERSSGKDLAGFFDQWLLKPGYPVFNVLWKYDEASSLVQLEVTQVQNRALPGGVAGTVPVFKGPLPIEVDGIRHTIQINSEWEVHALPSKSRPRYVNFNSDNDWLAQVHLHQELGEWQGQLKYSLDVTARVRAVQSLQGYPESTASILECARQDSETWVRIHCLNSLEWMMQSAPESVQITIVNQAIELARADENWEVREAAVSLLGRAKAQSAMAMKGLVEVLRTDVAVKVVAAAAHSVGKIAAENSYDTLLGLLGRESFQDGVRQSVFTGLSYLADLRSLAMSQKYIMPRNSERIRRGAMDLLVALGLKWPEQASEAARQGLESLLRDDSFNIRINAVRALGRLKNAKAIEALQNVQLNDPEGRVRTAAQRAIAAIRG